MTVLALILLTSLLSAGQVSRRIAVVAAGHRRATPGRLAQTGGGHHRLGLSPLELLLAPGGVTRHPGRVALADSHTVGGNAGDNTFWPDSSTPVREAPSNSTAGPPPPSLPSFPGWNLSKIIMDVGGRQRYYLVARPTSVTAAPLPVLLVLPGRDMTPARIARASRFLSLVGPAVVVYPAGFANSWNAGYCCGVAHLADVNDVAFIEQVIRNVLATQPGTSAHQVYITGFSNGGRMALDMACADPGAFAGVAAVEAVAVSSCVRANPVPLLEVAYTRDPLLTVYADAPPKHIAGHVEVTVQALVERWRALDGCLPTPERTSYPVMTLTVWPHCRAAGRVGMAVYAGGPHAWPHGGPGTPPAQTVVWDFFHRVTPSGPPDTGAPA